MLNASRFFLRGLTTGLKSLNQVRFYSSKQMLEEPGIGSCCSGTKEGEGCGSPKPPKVKGPGKKAYSAECFDDPCCPYPHKSYDEHYKHLLKHKKRTIFQKTWKECPPRRLVQKLVCGEPEPAPKCKVERPKTPPTELGCYSTDRRCPKIKMPGCRPVEHRKFCKQLPHPLECEKIKCPYPSFSECQRSLPKPLRQTECHCLQPPCVCEILNFLKAKGRLSGKK